MTSQVDFQAGIGYRPNGICPHDEQVQEIEANDAVESAASTKKEMTILAFLVYSRSKYCRDILAHPVAQTFIELKWARMKGPLLLINILLKVAVYALYIFLAMQIYFIDCPHYPVRNYTLLQGPTATNSSQLEDTVECSWSLWTMVLLPVVLLFLSLFLVHHIVMADRIRKCKKKFLSNQIACLRVSTRTLFLILAIATTIPPLVQRSLLEFQYPLAAVRAMFRLFTFRL
jgi:hypothetical protein